MKIYIAEEAGFCFGVKRALKIIERLHEKGQSIQVFGQLIHNQSVLEKLKQKGIGCIERLEEIDRDKTLVIRTHGIPKETERHLEERAIPYVDATCPFVKKIHRIIEKIDSRRSQIVIVGDKNHPEIIAARSYAGDVPVVNSAAEVRRLDLKGKNAVSVVAQTTLNVDLFKQIVSALLDRAEKTEVYNTICSATRKRQEAIKDLAPGVDVVVVVGSRNSSNTRKLFEIAQKRNRNTFLIENKSELDNCDFLRTIDRFHSVGITAGASTPPEQLEEVEEFFKNLKPDNIEKEMKNGRRKRDSRH